MFCVIPSVRIARCTETFIKKFGEYRALNLRFLGIVYISFADVLPNRDLYILNGFDFEVLSRHLVTKE